VTRYLLVDNGPAIIATLRAEILVADRTATFEEADNGERALQVARAWNPEVVFTGLGLANGERALPLVDRLLRDEPLRPVVVCTSLPRTSPEVEQAVGLGAFAYLAKPIQPADLKHIVTQIESRQGRLRRVR